MRCRTVALTAVKLVAVPLVDEFYAPLLFGFTDATSKAGAAGDCARIEIEHAMITEMANATLCIFTRLPRFRDWFCGVLCSISRISSIAAGLSRRPPAAPPRPAPAGAAGAALGLGGTTPSASAN